MPPSPCRVLIVLLVTSACPAPDEPPPEGGSTEVFVDPRLTPFVDDADLADGQLALTFDDGPDPETTGRILDTLLAHGVQATFFQVGMHAESHPEITRRIIAEGHSLGSHSWDHEDLATLPLAEAIDNLERGHGAVQDAAGSQVRFFRLGIAPITGSMATRVGRAGVTVRPGGESGG